MRKRSPKERACIDRLAGICARAAERAVENLDLSAEIELSIDGEELDPKWTAEAMDRAIDIVHRRIRLHPGSCDRNSCDLCVERWEILEQLEKAAAEIRAEEGLP